MGYDRRPASWGKDSPRVSAKLKPCSCGVAPTAGTDTMGMWSLTCSGCSSGYAGDDNLGCETWQELVKGWNAQRAST